ncbi:sulfotransferase family protein, partial [Mycobacterium sp. ITM-2017-0098]
MTDTTEELIHLEDLAEPRYSPEAQQLRQMMTTLAADCPLDTEVLHARAREATGLQDFGPDDYRERLDRYVSELSEIDMHGPGIVNFHAQLVQWLKNRLLLT